jgi:pyruvate kinase
MITKKQSKYIPLIEKLEQIIERAESLEHSSSDILDRIHPKYRKSACNLLHYRALRSYDLRKLQKKLGYLGLSRLAKSQSHVMSSLQTTLAILKAMDQKGPITANSSELSFKAGTKALRSNAKKLLGYRSKKRRTRIMVTLPSEAAEDYQLVRSMIAAGMNCARINCAHDTEAEWSKMVTHVRKASKELRKKCKIAMDLAGPKIRTGPLEAGPKVRKIKPDKDISGQVSAPATVWIGVQPALHGIHLPVSEADLLQLEGVKQLYFRDTRNKKRKITHLYPLDDGYIGLCEATSYIETGMPLFSEKKEQGIQIQVGELPVVEMPILLKEGDQLRIDKKPGIGHRAIMDTHGHLMEVAHISCTAPEVFEQVKEGEKILFDDGKITGLITEVSEQHLWVSIQHATNGLAKLRSDKGINLPESTLSISGLTEKDKADLPFVAANADVVNFSFVNRPEDVAELIHELEKLDAKDQLGVILKIETQSGFNQLTDILLEAMQVYPIGVMIARGDLAIETGWNNIGRVQEEILSLCQAAHITDIWATQVLEGLAKKGIPSRAEITDAVMAQRADCVMLNKGPYILDAIELMSDILIDMEPFWEKNSPLSPMLMKAE